MPQSARIIGKYRKLLEDGSISSDPAQELVVEKLQLLALRLQRYDPGRVQRAARGWFGFGAKAAKQEPLLNGLYIYGGVGRGKTMLMDLFFDAVTFEPRRRVHFHGFMQEVHALVKEERARSDKGDPLPAVAKRIAKDAILLCFDEFLVNDIADAMIMGRLFTALFESGVIVVATSNRPPDDLYKHGLNRQLFLPFIDLLKVRADIIHLESPTDYRLAGIKRGGVYTSPLGPAADAAMDAAWGRLTAGATVETGTMEVQGRNVPIPIHARGAARFGFEDLCGRPLGPADFLSIAQRFHTVLVDRIPQLGPDRRNEAKRFVTLVDALYNARSKLVCSADAAPDDLYPAGDESFEFQRTASRLHEMATPDYLETPHVSRARRYTVSATA